MPRGTAGSPHAYVELYAETRPPPRDSHGFWTIRKAEPSQRRFIIIPLSNIRQSCHLIPAFGEVEIPHGITHQNVLDSCVSTFYVNKWADLFSYQTIW